MSLRKRRLIIIVIGFLLVSFLPPQVRAASCEDSCEGKEGDQKLDCLTAVQAACEAKLKETNAKKQTLQSTIDYFDNQIYLTQSQINQTTYQIEALQQDIDGWS